MFAKLKLFKQTPKSTTHAKSFRNKIIFAIIFKGNSKSINKKKLIWIPSRDGSLIFLLKCPQSIFYLNIPSRRKRGKNWPQATLPSI